MICLWHTVPFRTLHHTAATSLRRRSGVSRFSRPGSLPAASRTAPSPEPRCHRAAHAARTARSRSRPEFRPARRRAVSERPPRVAAPDTGEGTGRWPGRGADGAGSGARRHGCGPGRGTGPLSLWRRAAGWRREAAPRPALPAAGRAMLLTGSRIRASGACRGQSAGRGEAGAPGRPGPPSFCSSFPSSSSSSRFASARLAGTRSPGRRARERPRAGRWRRAPSALRRRSRAVSPCGAKGGACAAPGERRGRVPLCAAGSGLRCGPAAAGGRGQSVLGCSTVRAHLGCVPSAIPTAPVSARPSFSQSLSAWVPEAMRTSPGLY